MIWKLDVDGEGSKAKFLDDVFTFVVGLFFFSDIGVDSNDAVFGADVDLVLGIARDGNLDVECICCSDDVVGRDEGRAKFREEGFLVELVGNIQKDFDKILARNSGLFGRSEELFKCA